MHAVRVTITPRSISPTRTIVSADNHKQFRGSGITPRFARLMGEIFNVAANNESKGIGNRLTGPEGRELLGRREREARDVRPAMS